jgi:hypothetical protein
MIATMDFQLHHQIGKKKKKKKTLEIDLSNLKQDATKKE